MRLIPLFAFAAAAIAAPALAQPAAGDTCHEAARVIDDGLKDLATAAAQDTLDDSAPRSTMRAAQSTALFAMIQANMTLLQEGRCPMPKLPISSGVYLEAASRCVQRGGGDPVACDRSTWQPGPRWRTAPAG